MAGPLTIHPGPLLALAATARLANLPSVVSNVLLGVLLVASAEIEPGISSVLVAGVCLYLCGGFLNDWVDRKWDADRRPERALPRGCFTPRVYLGAGLAMAACGLAAAAMADWHALAVAAAIAANVGFYTWLHKKSAWAAVFMGLCRALLPLLGWAATGDATLMPAVLLAGFALFFHVAGISLLARGESLELAVHGAHRAYGCFAVPAMVMFFCSVWIFEIPAASAMVGLLPYVLWTGLCLFRRIGTAARISGLLAGIPLVDWMLLLPLHLSLVSARPEAGLAGMCLWLPPVAFLAGRALQWLAPAT